MVAIYWTHWVIFRLYQLGLIERWVLIDDLRRVIVIIWLIDSNDWCDVPDVRNFLLLTINDTSSSASTIVLSAFRGN